MKYGYLYQGQRYKWQRSAAATPASESAARGSSSPTSKTTIRSPIRPAASACTSSPAPDALKAMTALPAAGARHAHAVSGSGVRVVQALSLLRRSQGRVAQTGARRPHPVSVAVPAASRSPRCAAAILPTPAILQLSSAASWISRSAKRTRPSIVCTKICCACAAKMPCSARRAARGRRGTRRAGIRAAILWRRARRSACCWSISAPILLSTSLPSRCSRRPQDRLWATSLVERRHPQYGGCGTPPPDGPDNWRIPGESAVVMRPDGVNPWD